MANIESLLLSEIDNTANTATTANTANVHGDSDDIDDDDDLHPQRHHIPFHAHEVAQQVQTPSNQQVAAAREQEEQQQNGLEHVGQVLQVEEKQEDLPEAFQHRSLHPTLRPKSSHAIKRQPR
jgi:hypothetical protein